MEDSAEASAAVPKAMVVGDVTARTVALGDRGRAQVWRCPPHRSHASPTMAGELMVLLAVPTGAGHLLVLISRPGRDKLCGQTLASARQELLDATCTAAGYNGDPILPDPQTAQTRHSRAQRGKSRC